MLPINVIECRSTDIFYLLSLCFIVAIAVKLILIELLHFPLLKYTLFRTSPVVQWIRICLPVQETWVQSLSQEDPLEKKMATHSSILAWEIPWTEEAGGLHLWDCKELTHQQQNNRNNNINRNKINNNINVLATLLPQCWVQIFNL